METDSSPASTLSSAATWTEAIVSPANSSAELKNSTVKLNGFANSANRGDASSDGRISTDPLRPCRDAPDGAPDAVVLIPQAATNLA